MLRNHITYTNSKYVSRLVHALALNYTCMQVDTGFENRHPRNYPQAGTGTDRNLGLSLTYLQQHPGKATKNKVCVLLIVCDCCCMCLIAFRKVTAVKCKPKEVSKHTAACWRTVSHVVHQIAFRNTFSAMETMFCRIAGG